jgi:hypothetical protein
MPMAELHGTAYSYELARLRSRTAFGPGRASILTLAVVGGLTTATLIMVAALAGSL